MVMIGNKRSVMTLYSDAQDIYSHRVRIVLAEKGVAVDIINVCPGDLPEDLLDVNPYNSVPTLVDRELVLYESRIIMEYLDERFPHPPLLPVYPVSRSQSRLMMYRIEQDLYHQYYQILRGHDAQAESARKELTEGLLSIAPVFAEQPFFLSEDFSLVDCSLAPLLWRLPEVGINLESHQGGSAITAYADKLFDRESFQASLTDAEREIRIRETIY